MATDDPHKPHPGPFFALGVVMLACAAIAAIELVQLALGKAVSSM